MLESYKNGLGPSLLHRERERWELQEGSESILKCSSLYLYLLKFTYSVLGNK